MEILLQTYYIVLSGIMTIVAAWAGVTYKRGQKEKEKNKEELERKKREDDKIREANSRAIMLLLRYMLKRYHSEYMLQGRITYAQYNDWKDIFETYSDLSDSTDDYFHIAADWDRDIESLPRTDAIPNLSPFEAMLRKNMDK